MKASFVLVIAVGCAIVGLLVAAFGGGIGNGSWPGAVCAAVGIPLCLHAMWQGIQQKRQTQLGLAVAGLVLSIGVTALLVILKLLSIGKGLI